VRLLRGWERFWFAPQSTSTLGLLRICYATLVVAWALSLAPDLGAFYAGDAMALAPEALRPPWSAVWTVGEPQAVAILCWIGLVIGAVALGLGWHARLASVLVVTTMTALHLRNPLILNSGDTLLRLVGIYIMLAPSGAAISLDQWRRSRNFWQVAARTPWALRLVQLQLTVMYLSTVLAKLVSGSWLAGTAMWSVWHLEELHRLNMVPVALSAPWIVPVVSVGTVVVEISLGLLVWSRRLRPWVLLIGVLFHLAIEATMLVGLFSWLVVVTYIAFIPPEVGDRVVAVLRDRVRARAVSAGGQSPSSSASVERASAT
jgi:hypothetical protein